ncbi:MAG TPA: metallophosphoesterase [Chthoniobacteraceae bacterium]|jgi:Icc-related predicted phosphoesterase|nr:metallophosphoesterase [Chthoniobacteraceae bacterium]
MRLHVVSDLHQEFGEIDVPAVDCDCVVIAGDVSTKLHGLEWILRKFRECPVIYVCGNHEFYGEKLPRLTERLRDQAQGTNVHLLENDSVTICGLHFFGCTLWTDMSLHGDWIAGAAEANNVMNDYKRIRNSALHYKRLSARDTRLLHIGSLEAMRRFFAAHDPRHSVVVTHHAPSIRSLPADRRDEPISCAYTSHLDPFIEEHQPQLWIHGHIHHSQDYRIGGTRVLANPRAYPGEPNPGFVADLVVTVEGEGG